MTVFTVLQKKRRKFRWFRAAAPHVLEVVVPQTDDLARSRHRCEQANVFCGPQSAIGRSIDRLSSQSQRRLTRLQKRDHLVWQIRLRRVQIDHVPAIITHQPRT
jgi:hypothetical protein